MRDSRSGGNWRGVWRLLRRVAMVALQTQSLHFTLAAFAFMVISLYILKSKSQLYVKVYNAQMIWLVELVSIAVSLVGYSFIWRVLLLAPPSMGPRSRDDETPVSSPFVAAEAPRLQAPGFFGWLQRGWGVRRWTMKAVYAALVVCAVGMYAIHHIVHAFIPVHHRQSQEIVLLLSRAGVDFFFLIVGVSLSITDAWKRITYYLQVQEKGSSEAKRILQGMRLIKTGFFALVALVLLWMSMAVMGTATMPHLRVSVIRGAVDPCKAEGLELDPNLVTSWVLPAIHLRRLYNFYIGSESCSSRGWHSFGYLEKEEEVLLLSPQCRNGERPRVYIERPERSELNGDPAVRLPDTVEGNMAYHRVLEELYGDDAKAKSAGVIVHRDKGRILSVELDPKELKEEMREPKSDAEREARRFWPRGNAGNTVIAVKLGRSAAYSVECGAEEEYFVHPRTPPAPWSKGGKGSCPGASPPSGSVLMIMFDALSRQGTVRQLPKFVQWVRDFKKRQEERSGEGYVVKELDHTTLGFSTAGNVPPYLTGSSVSRYDARGVRRSTLNFMDHSVFNLVKAEYGERVSTSITVDFCSDMMEYMLFGQENASGAGVRYQGVDYYTFQPFCHAEYTGTSSNYKGPYSIVPRCIDNRYVHSHTLDYLEVLVRRQLRDVAAHKDDCEHFFFDFAHFIEGHEGTQAVLPLMDDELTGFMQSLEDMGFFRGGRNSLMVIADHGHHMGPYFELTDAGHFERTTPLMLYFVHPEVMRRIDKRKGKAEGTSLSNLESRSTRMNTPLDTYMTLGDLLGMNFTAQAPYQNTQVPPTSLFELRKGSEKFDPHRNVYSCFEFFDGKEPDPCLLSYCRPRT